MRIAVHSSAATRAAWNAAQNALLGYPREAMPLGGGRHVDPPPISEFVGETEDPDPPHTPAVWVDGRVTVDAVNDSTKLSAKDRADLLAMLAATKDIVPASVAPVVIEAERTR